MKLLDCTLRDGGFYTNWDFDKPVVDTYISALNNLPIDYIEIGYRNLLKNEYFGKYFYLPLYELQDIKEKSNKKLVVILMEDDVHEKDLDELLSPIVGIADMVRLAFAPKNIRYAINLARKIKKYGFEIGFNVMYMSEWLSDPSFIKNLSLVDEVADCFYMVDSYGGVFPQDMKEIIDMVKEKVKCPIGFHGHDNLHMAMANTLIALDNGVEYIDGTIMGMGRGAGNLRTELLLTVLNKKYNLNVDFYELERAVSVIQPLWKEHLWGSNLPYMISGSNSFSQGAVMDWETSPFYSTDSIIRTLNSHKNNAKDYAEYPSCEFEATKKVLIVGAGSSVGRDIKGIRTFLHKYPEITIIHSSSTNLHYFTDLPHKHYFCLVGNAGKRLERRTNYNGPCILPPAPEKTGTYVPEALVNKTCKIKSINYDSKIQDRQTALALQVAENLSAKEVYLVGYDGVSPQENTQREYVILEQNEEMFKMAIPKFDKFESLTETNYAIPDNANLFYYLAE